MTSAEWDKICNYVTEMMRCYTRPFATPLFDRNKLVGSGNYVKKNDHWFIVTCEHVAKVGQFLDYKFYGLDKEFRNHGEWEMEPPVVDLAVAPLLYEQWHEIAHHHAQAVPYERFASEHTTFDKSEIMFFRGYAGENSSSLGGLNEARASAYNSQEIVGSRTATHFDMFWDLEKTQYTNETTEEERSKVKFENPRGISGSLVWNTRYREVTEGLKKRWTPDDAVVTGMAQRWDEATKSIIVYRVEHVRKWIEPRLNTPT